MNYLWFLSAEHGRLIHSVTLYSRYVVILLFYKLTQFYCIFGPTGCRLPDQLKTETSETHPAFGFIFRLHAVDFVGTVRVLRRGRELCCSLCWLHTERGLG